MTEIYRTRDALTSEVDGIRYKLAEKASIKQCEMMARAMVANNDFDPSHYEIVYHSEVTHFENGTRCDLFAEIKYKGETNEHN